MELTFICYWRHSVPKPSPSMLSIFHFHPFSLLYRLLVSHYAMYLRPISTFLTPALLITSKPPNTFSLMSSTFLPHVF